MTLGTASLSLYCHSIAALQAEVFIAFVSFTGETWLVSSDARIALGAP